MNYLKKKLKPLTAGFNQQTSSSTTAPGGPGTKNRHRDLEEDLYDEYVVEAPPHPSELLALGVEPTEIDVNDPDKLRELYKRVKEEGKDKKTNSVLLARQRQKEEIEEKKRTREEWKFFDSLSSRVEQVVKESQKNLDHWKESSTLSELAEPEYELRQTADEVFKPVTTVKLEKGQNNWIGFEADEDKKANTTGGGGANKKSDLIGESQQVEEFGCPASERRKSSAKPSQFVVEELLEDFGIDLRTAEQKRALEERQRREKEEEQKRLEEEEKKRRREEAERQQGRKSSIDIKATAVARPRPRPRGAARDQEEQAKTPQQEEGSTSEQQQHQQQHQLQTEESKPPAPAPEVEPEPIKFIDPFDTSYVKLE